MKNIACVIFLMWLSITSFGQSKSYIITQYGAKPDAITNNAKAIQRLIDQVAAKGGGKIIVPPGNFMTGTINLKSGITLHVQQGATLLGSTNTNDYEGVFHRRSIIKVVNQHDVAVTGTGVIDGQGQELMLDIFQKLRSGQLTQDSMWLYKRPEVGRTNLLLFMNCTNVSVSGITLKNCTNWVQDYMDCDGVKIDHITVQSTAYWNNDGLDVSNSKHVRITNCFINASDDAICLKSPTKNSLCDDIYIDSCVLRSSANGFKMGTSSFGGFRNIKVRNVTVFDTYRSAIALELVDGGIMENIDIRNVQAKHTGNAIFIRRGNRGGGTGSMKNIYIRDVVAEIPLLKPDQGYPLEGPPDHLKPGEDKMPKRLGQFHIYGHPYLPYNLVPSSIVGIPGFPVEGVTIENVRIQYGGRADKNIAYIPLDKITTVPENISNYPEFSMFGELPSWGFYVRHANGVQFKNIQLSLVEDDFRPAMVMDDVQNCSISSLTIPTNSTLPAIQLNNTKATSIKDIKLNIPLEKAILTTNYQ